MKAHAPQRSEHQTEYKRMAVKRLLTVVVFSTVVAACADLPQSLNLQNPWLSLAFDTTKSALSITDKRINRTWSESSGDSIVNQVRNIPNGLALILHDRPSNRDLKVTLQLDPATA